MDKLPTEMLKKIFQNVDQVDQLLNCKIVCKKWYSIIHQMIRLNSLAISEIRYYKILLSEKWFDPNEPIQFLYDYQYKVVSRHSKLIRFNMNQPLLSQLKKLFIYCRNIWTNSINCLRQLEVLSLKDSKLSSKTDISLNLPNLKAFSYKQNDHYDKLTLTCPNLEKLAYFHSFGNLSIIHPESIKEVQIHCKEDFIFDIVNCEYLYMEYGHFDENILLKLTKLKELHINRKDLDTLDRFIEQKRTLKRTNLKIYHLNLLSDSFANLDQFNNTYRYYSLDSNTIQLYGPNYSNLPNNAYFISSADYNVLENYFWTNPNQIARSIIKKLVHLNQLIISDQIRDLNQFVGILKDRVYLNRLRITAQFIPQTFFDQILSKNCSIIEYLLIYNKNQLNFDFLFKFKELRFLFSTQQMTSDLIFKLFDRFELLEALGFQYGGSEVGISLHDRRKFKIRLDGVRNVFDNLEDLMTHLEIYHQKNPFSSDDYLDNFIFKS